MQFVVLQHSLCKDYNTLGMLLLMQIEAAELERRNEELAKDNAALDTENEKYWGMYSTSPAHGGPCVMGDVLSGLPSTEEVDGLKRRIEELEARLDHSMIPDLQCVCVHALVQLFRLK